MTEPNRPARTGQPFSVDDVPVDLTQIMRSVAPQAVERIALRVQLEVPAYAGPIDGDRHRLVLGTVDQAVSHFLDVVEHKPTSDARVFRLVSQLGQAEAAEGNSLDSLRAAHHIATQAAWEEIRKALKETDADPEVLNRLVDGLFVYVDRLLSSVAAGHKSVSRGTDNTLQQARRKLLMSMLAGHPPERYAQHLAAADWEPPEEARGRRRRTRTRCRLRQPAQVRSRGARRDHSPADHRRGQP
ncbi:hypothetical protein [Aeromicrobium sp. UC242_57]|uniref:hypothetical protein n=1 Tax=Aeromicrobium sp. UC242_57 TaxID=3374624 RepID=UPI0037A3EDB2